MEARDFSRVRLHDCKFNDYVFYGQDNNDGQFYLYVMNDGTFKYTFTDYNCNDRLAMDYSENHCEEYYDDII